MAQNHPAVSSIFEIQYRKPLLYLSAAAMALLTLVMICCIVPIVYYLRTMNLLPAVFSALALFVTILGTVAVYRNNHQGLRGYLICLCIFGIYLCLQVAILTTLESTGVIDMSFRKNLWEDDGELSAEERARKRANERAEAEEKVFVFKWGIATNVFFGLYFLVAISILFLLSINVCACCRRCLGRRVEYPNAQLYLPTPTSHETHLTAIPRPSLSVQQSYEQQQIAKPLPIPQMPQIHGYMNQKSYYGVRQGGEAFHHPPNHSAPPTWVSGPQLPAGPPSYRQTLMSTEHKDLGWV